VKEETMAYWWLLTERRRKKGFIGLKVFLINDKTG